MSDVTWLVDTQCPDCGTFDSMTVVTGDGAADCMVDVQCPECSSVFCVDIRDRNEVSR